jgi:hypothetical protein
MESLQVVAIALKYLSNLVFWKKQRVYKMDYYKGKQFPNLFLKIKINPNKQNLSVYANYRILDFNDSQKNEPSLNSRIVSVVSLIINSSNNCTEKLTLGPLRISKFRWTGLHLEWLQWQLEYRNYKSLKQLRLSIKLPSLESTYQSSLHKTHQTKFSSLICGFIVAKRWI